jgi:hypothetical protein
LDSESIISASDLQGIAYLILAVAQPGPAAEGTVEAVNL